MTKRTKFLALVTFMAGALCLSGSIAKAYIYIKAREDRFFWDGITLITALSIWNLAEVQIGIVAACGPTLRQPLARLMPSTEAVTSLLSKIGLRRHSEKIKSNHIPSFVQPPQQASTQSLQDISRVALIVTQKNQSEYTGQPRAEERAEVIAQDKKEILRQVKLRWLGLNGCFRGTELDNPSFVPSKGRRWARVFDEEHPNAKAWLDKLPAFSFAVRVHAHDFEEETRLLNAKRARLRGGNEHRRWADMPLSVAAFSWTNW
ncbi:hypothetical protein INS49_011856 [Diaporthe citri]|uniref:uncharacterized protein n=1 Tax=Diaporthe citri TaxID=83186 RepID=UPI001C7F17B5|nr:uncharacterized protein INS49_011856 [Diaporthe citri]KAG6360789.1 hypothetical protein INS49_011856 [Diaporthe citri]